MADSIVDQNRKLAGAVDTPRDTSSRKENSDDQAAKVATTKKVSKQVSDESSSELRNLSSSKLRGSFEGLDASSGTLLSPANTGYDNKGIQTARYKDKPQLKPDEGLLESGFNNKAKYSIMDNYSSFGVKGTSMDRLSGIVKNNMMFG